MKAPKGSTVLVCCECDKTVGWIETIEGYRVLHRLSADFGSPWVYEERPREITEQLIEDLRQANRYGDPAMLVRCPRDHLTEITPEVLDEGGRRGRRPTRQVPVDEARRAMHRKGPTIPHRPRGTL